MPANGSGALSGAASGAAAGTAILPGWGTAIGAVIGGIGGLFGKSKAPQTATYRPVDVGKAEAEAISANSANFKSASELAAKTNSFNLQQQQSMLEKAIPGFGAIQSKLLASINDDLSGQMPAAVQQNLQRLAAEKGITRGVSGQFNQFSMLRDMGVNMMDWANASRMRALSTLSSVYGMAPRVSPMSPMSMFITPGEALQTQGNNNLMAYNSQQAAYNTAAAVSNYNGQMYAGLFGNVSNTLGAVYDANNSKSGAKTPDYSSV